MSTNLLSNTAPSEGLSSGPRGLLAALVALLLALATYLKRKVVGQPELMNRVEFCNEMREIGDRIHADHLVLLEKLDTNHRELLAALARQGARIGALEVAVGRLDERTSL